jgi:hypothetical protein
MNEKMDYYATKLAKGQKEPCLLILDDGAMSNLPSKEAMAVLAVRWAWCELGYDGTLNVLRDIEADRPPKPKPLTLAQHLERSGDPAVQRGSAWHKAIAMTWVHENTKNVGIGMVDMRTRTLTSDVNCCFSAVGIKQFMWDFINTIRLVYGDNSSVEKEVRDIFDTDTAGKNPFGRTYHGTGDTKPLA